MPHQSDMNDRQILDCPNCPNQGWYVNSQGDQEQCQFCYCEPGSRFNYEASMRSDMKRKDMTTNQNSEHTPEPWKDQKYLDRFWSRVAVRGEDECWEWTGCLTAQGYGNFHFVQSSIRAHRFSYQAKHGAISEHDCVCHACDNTKCVNPKHLWLGTRTENNADKLAKGRNMPPPVRTGEQHHTAVLTTPEVIAAKVMARKGLPQARIANYLGVSPALICNIVGEKVRADETERRVSACVNACQGVDTEELERTRNIGDIIEFNAKGAHEQAGLEVEALQLRVTSLEGALKALVDCYYVGYKDTALFCKHVEPFMEEARSLLSPSGPQEA